MVGMYFVPGGSCRTFHAIRQTVIFFLLYCTLLIPAAAQDINPEETPSDPVQMRKLFLPEKLKPFADGDMFLPISPDSSVPTAEYLRSCVELLQINAGSTVLVLGRAIGYSASYIALSAEKVYAAEQDPSMDELNRGVWSRLGFSNIVPVLYPDFFTPQETEELDGILIHGIVQEIPPLLSNALAPGGILLAPMSNRREVQMMMKVKKENNGFSISSEDLSFFPNRPLNLFAQ